MITNRKATIHINDTLRRLMREESWRIWQLISLQKTNEDELVDKFAKLFFGRGPEYHE